MKLLVIGNGFDKYLGSKTSYSDFFNSDFYKETLNKLKEWKKICNPKPKTAEAVENILKSEIDLKKVNIWDLLFYLYSDSDSMLQSDKEMMWCDIEKVMYNIFLYRYNSVNTLFQDVKEYINKYEENEEVMQIGDYYVYLVGLFCIKMNYGKYFVEPESIYQWLLKELRVFEHKFGEYIRKETMDKDGYTDLAIDTVARLLSSEPDQFYFIDSFNYSDFSSSSVCIRHINGDVHNPIFGINANSSELNRNFFATQFTKNSRRLNQDVFEINPSMRTIWRDIDEVVIFGHSLNEMDYDYFNYIFTILKFYTLASDEMGTVKFVYNVYSQDEEKIKNEFSKYVYNLIDWYEREILGNQYKILLNLLRFSNKLKIEKFE